MVISTTATDPIEYVRQGVIMQNQSIELLAVRDSLGALHCYLSLEEGGKLPKHSFDLSTIEKH